MDGTGSGLSSPKGGRSFGRGFFSAAPSMGVTSTASTNRIAVFTSRLLLLRRGGRGRLAIDDRAVGHRKVRRGDPLQIGRRDGLELLGHFIHESGVPRQELGERDRIGAVDG